MAKRGKGNNNLLWGSNNFLFNFNQVHTTNSTQLLLLELYFY
jgi:hypothetical protein